MQPKQIHFQELEIAKQAFRRGTLLDIFEHGECSKKLQEIASAARTKKIPFDNNFELFNTLYGLLSNSYRNEYVFKNSIAEKILVGRHRTNGATLLSEFKIRKNIADTVIINGTSTVYEIKTELDSLDRLPSQISAYKKVFDKIYVVTTQEKAASIAKVIEPIIGVLTLSKRNSLSLYKEAQSNKNNVCNATIFSCLRKYEYEKSILERFKKLPSALPIDMGEACLKLFNSLPPNEAHELMVKRLRERKPKTITAEIIKKIPRSLISATLTTNPTAKEINNLHSAIRF